MNWGNIARIMEMYTQHKHYQILFDKYKLPKKISNKEMYKVFYEAVVNDCLIAPVITQEEFEDWFAYHQIDGNNYSFVYYLENKSDTAMLQNLYINRNKLITKRIWEINPENESEDVEKVMTNLNGIDLVGIHHDPLKKTFTFSYIAPCIVSGRSKEDGRTRLYKKIFFGHCVLFEDSNYCKVVINPTTHLQHVNGVSKGKGGDWTPIASMFFVELEKYIGNQIIKAPNWIPQGLHRLAEEATSHNNPKITAYSFNAEQSIIEFAEQLLKRANIEVEKDQALIKKFSQDIQQSFEAQLVEKYGVNKESDSFEVFKQRSDGVTHVINVESREAGLRQGVAAQAARRSRADSDIDLLGVILKTNERMYRFLVEHGSEAYLIRGTNTFVEEEVVNIVIRKLNEYRDEIQSATLGSRKDSTDDLLPTAK